MKFVTKDIVIRILSLLVMAAATVSVILTVPKVGTTNEKVTTVETTTKATTTETTTEEKTEEVATVPAGNGGGNTVQTTAAPQTYTPVKYTGGALPYCDPVDSSYWSESVFIGDSVSVKLQWYNGLPGAMYLCKSSFGVTNALNGVLLPNGQMLDTAVANSGRKRVYIMLGMNDLNRTGVYGTVSKYQQLVYTITSRNPGCLIYIQSMTPITAYKNGTNGKTLNNDNIRLYNQALSSMANANGWYFVDVASVMYDDAGNLKDEYCSDNSASGMGLHFSNAGCAAWVWYLNTHAYDPSWAVYTLTIHYKNTNGATVAPNYSVKYKAGDTFNIPSPAVAGYTPDKASVSGTFAHASQEFTVTYKEIPTTTQAPTTTTTTTQAPTTTTTTQAPTTTTTTTEQVSE